MLVKVRYKKVLELKIMLRYKIRHIINPYQKRCMDFKVNKKSMIANFQTTNARLLIDKNHQHYWIFFKNLNKLSKNNIFNNKIFVHEEKNMKSLYQDL